jgi:drug/metabolite transporter (DMT)-like permease
MCDHPFSALLCARRSDSKAQSPRYLGQLVRQQKFGTIPLVVVSLQMPTTGGGLPLLVYGLIAVNIILLVTGQLLFKIGLHRIGAVTLHNLYLAFLSPLVVLGLCLYVIATACWFAILSRAELSVVYPLQSLSYVLGLVASVFILHEVVPPIRWIGVCVILVGVFLVSYQAKL